MLYLVLLCYVEFFTLEAVINILTNILLINNGVQ